MEDSRKNKIRENIKKAGSIVIYIGTASLMRPYITRDNENRNAVGKACAFASGTVISCGISASASKFFGKMVDKVADFIEDVKPPKKKEGSSDGSK